MIKQDFDFTETLKKYHGNEKVARDLIATFLHELSRAKARINHAFREKNREQMTDILHKLKGSCGILGMTSLTAFITKFYESTLNPMLTFNELADPLAQFNNTVSDIMVYQQDFQKNASS